MVTIDPRIHLFVKEITRQAKNTWTRAAITPWEVIQGVNGEERIYYTHSESRLYDKNRPEYQHFVSPNVVPATNLLQKLRIIQLYSAFERGGETHPNSP